MVIVVMKTGLCVEETFGISPYESHTTPIALNRAFARG